MATYFVVGASRGIGLSLVEQLLVQTYDSVIAGIRSTNEELQALHSKYPERLSIVTIDINSTESVKSAAQVVSERHPKGIDCLIINAGVGANRTIDIPPEEFLACLNTNTVGPFRVIQSFLPQVLKSEKKVIVGISTDYCSMTIDSGGESFAYRASKAAFNSLLVTLSRTYKSDGILFIPIHPGWVDTDLGRAGGGNPPMHRDESAKHILKVIHKVKLEDDVKLLNYDGTPVPW